MMRPLRNPWMFIIAALALAWQVGNATAEISPVGRWWTFDEKTGVKNGVIEITQNGDELEGKIVEIIPQPGDPPNPLCEKCEGAQKDQPVLGLTIMKGFKREGAEWNGGTILDPFSGDIYSCEMSVADNGKKLLVRGYLGIPLLGRTETWVREE